MIFDSSVLSLSENGTEAVSERITRGRTRPWWPATFRKGGGREAAWCLGERCARWKTTAIAVILHFSHHLTGVSEEINVEHGSRAPFRACLCFHVPCVVLWLHYHNLIIVFSQPFGALLQSLAKAIEVYSKYNRNVVTEDRQWLNVVNVIVSKRDGERND